LVLSFWDIKKLLFRAASENRNVIIIKNAGGFGKVPNCSEPSVWGGV